MGGVLNTADSVAYAFFSYGNVAKFTPASKVHYVALDGADPINAEYGPYTFQGTAYTAGQPPICTAPCGDTGGGPAAGTSYPNVRNGSYKDWTIVRIITDATGPNLTNAQTLVTAAQAEVDHLVPDFVPVVCTTAGEVHGRAWSPGVPLALRDSRHRHQAQQRQRQREAGSGRRYRWRCVPDPSGR